MLSAEGNEAVVWWLTANERVAISQLDIENNGQNADSTQRN